MCQMGIESISLTCRGWHGQVWHTGFTQLVLEFTCSCHMDELAHVVMGLPLLKRLTAEVKWDGRSELDATDIRLLNSLESLSLRFEDKPYHRWVPPEGFYFITSLVSIRLPRYHYVDFNALAESPLLKDLSVDVTFSGVLLSNAFNKLITRLSSSSLETSHYRKLEFPGFVAKLDNLQRLELALLQNQRRTSDAGYDLFDRTGTYLW